MPRSDIIYLAPKGKNGKSMTYTEIVADGLVSDGYFAGDAAFGSYSYGLKGRPQDLTIYGSASNEYLVTGDGNDTIDMIGGDNIVVSGGGNDIITTTSGTNYIDGGAGTDWYIMESGYVGDVDLSAGLATKPSGAEDYLFNIENVVGNNNDNVITGDENPNTIFTGGGTDTVYGGGGNDVIDAYTQTGPKTFVGGTGDDLIRAGADADEFYWAAGDGADTVYYFDASDGATGDTIFLDLDGDQTASTIAKLVEDGYLRIIENANSTTIEIDTTGTSDFGAASSITLIGTYSVTVLEGNIVDSTTDVPLA